MKICLTFTLCASLVSSSAMAQLGRHGGGERVNVQNRSTGANRTYNNNANVNRNVNNNANVNRNYNNNTNVNRNVNVNENVNVNRNVNVSGGCYNCGGYYHDNDWNWGSFAAGAAVAGVTTAAVASAARSSSSTTVVVQAPAVGTMVTALPGGCATINTPGGMIYNCNSVYYHPYYQGTTLMYQVVTYP